MYVVIYVQSYIARINHYIRTYTYATTICSIRTYVTGSMKMDQVGIKYVNIIIGFYKEYYIKYVSMVQISKQWL